MERDMQKSNCRAPLLRAGSTINVNGRVAERGAIFGQRGRSVPDVHD